MGTKRREGRPLVGLERQLGGQQVVIAFGKLGEPQIGHARVEVVGGTVRLTGLQQRVGGKDLEPALGRVAQLTERFAGVRHKQPPAVDVVGEHLGHRSWATAPRATP